MKHTQPGMVAQSDAHLPGVGMVGVRSSGPATFFHGDWL